MGSGQIRETLVISSANPGSAASPGALAGAQTGFALRISSVCRKWGAAAGDPRWLGIHGKWIAESMEKWMESIFKYHSVYT